MSALPGNLLEMQILRSHSRLIELDILGVSHNNPSVNQTFNRVILIKTQFGILTPPKTTSGQFVIVFYKDFFNVYLFLKEAEHEQGRGRERGRERI